MLYPDPFQPYTKGAWEQRKRPEALTAIRRALQRWRDGEISEDILRHDRNPDGIKVWLWLMHHPHNERWKNIGRPNWSLDAYLTWRRYYFAVPEEKRLASDGAPHLRTLPKESWAGEDGLHHEHVVPQSVSLKRLMAGHNPELVLACNVSAVITIRERDKLPSRATHPDPDNPWIRYRGTGIQMIENPSWSATERAALAQHDLLYRGEIPEFAAGTPVRPYPR